MKVSKGFTLPVEAFCTLLYAWKDGLIRFAAGVDAGFAYGLAYSLAIVFFGVRRIRRRKTPYVTRQTLTLIAIQVLPLFLLPQILLPWMNAHGWVPQVVKDLFFPGDSWWRAYGFVLAWPLFFWNLATEQPIGGWLAVSLLQTGVLIPWMVRRWGKGAYCGWICSCGGLAETLGDAHRDKMPHGDRWNRLNMAGQLVLALACHLLVQGERAHRVRGSRGFAVDLQSFDARVIHASSL